MPSPFELQMLELLAALKPTAPAASIGETRRYMGTVTSSGGICALAAYLFVTGVTARAISPRYPFSIGCANLKPF